MPHFPKRYADAAAKLRVTSGFIMAAVFVWRSRPSALSLAFGLPVALLGLALRAWAAGCLYKDRELATAGPYAYTRNPLYLGTLLAAMGLVIGSRSLWLGLLFAAVFAFVYLPAIELEQQHLGDLFPEYPGYAARVPMIIPQLVRGKPTPQPFRWAQYRKNREYQAALGFAAGAAWLIYRCAAR
jgi:protein-S-isoprenylcysteine O-methyltransferase Ste14